MPFVTEECDGGRIHIELSFFTSRKQVQKQNQIFRTEKKCWQVMAAFSNWSTHRTASKRARDENKNEVFYLPTDYISLAISRRRVVALSRLMLVILDTLSRNLEDLQSSQLGLLAYFKLSEIVKNIVYCVADAAFKTKTSCSQQCQNGIPRKFITTITFTVTLS